MPKAILELEMPESCKECKLGHYDELYGLTHCDILRECMPYEGRHKACPLKPVEENAIAAWNSRTGNDIVVRGEWKLYGNDDDLGMSYWCTACNFQLSEDLFYSGYKDGRWIENGVFKYCPNCGAKMEVE